jgi:predicted SAM-dependent methyltransferase
MKDFIPVYEEPKFKSLLKFEIESWLVRHFMKHRGKIIPSDSLLLDIGVGANFKAGWTHLDMYHLRLKFWKKYSTPRPEIETDLRYPLNCSDNIVDGIYSGHTLEHLYPNHAYKLLSEIYRILKPECWLRINVPDLKPFIDFYNGQIVIEGYKCKAEAIGDLTQNDGHHSVWDEECLSKALEITGFINICKVEFGKEGTDQRLIKEKDVRKKERLL